MLWYDITLYPPCVLSACICQQLPRVLQLHLFVTQRLKHILLPGAFPAALLQANDLKTVFSAAAVCNIICICVVGRTLVQ